MLTPRRFAAPLSASVALVLALSACTTSSVKSQESSPTMSESSAAAATSESSPVNTAAASESADDKLPVGLTDDNKAGKPRPRSSMKDTLKGATINEDGSWTYDKPDGTKLINTFGSPDSSIPVFKTGTLTISGSLESTINIKLENGRVKGEDGAEHTLTISYSGTMTKK